LTPRKDGLLFQDIPAFAQFLLASTDQLKRDSTGLVAKRSCC